MEGAGGSRQLRRPWKSLAEAERPAFLSQLEAWDVSRQIAEGRKLPEGTLMNDLIFLGDSGGEVCGGSTEAGMEAGSSEEQ